MTNQTIQQQRRTRQEIINSLMGEMTKTRIPMAVSVNGLRTQVTLKDLSNQLAQQHKAASLRTTLAPLPKHLRSLITATRTNKHSIFKRHKGIVIPAYAGVAYQILHEHASACESEIRASIDHYYQEIWTGVVGNTPRNASRREIDFAWQEFKTKHIVPGVGERFMSVAFPFATPEEYVSSATCTFKVLAPTQSMIDESMVMAAEIQRGLFKQSEEIYDALVASIVRVITKATNRVMDDKPFSARSFEAIFNDLEAIQSSTPTSCAEIHNCLRWVENVMSKFFMDVCSLPADKADAGPDGKYQSVEYRTKMRGACKKALSFLADE